MREFQKMMMDFSLKVWDGAETKEERLALLEIEQVEHDIDVEKYREWMVKSGTLAWILNSMKKGCTKKSELIQKIRAEKETFSLFQKEVNEWFKQLK